MAIITKEEKSRKKAKEEKTLGRNRKSRHASVSFPFPVTPNDGRHEFREPMEARNKETERKLFTNVTRSVRSGAVQFVNSSARC